MAHLPIIRRMHLTSTRSLLLRFNYQNPAVKPPSARERAGACLA